MGDFRTRAQRIKDGRPAAARVKNGRLPKSPVITTIAVCEEFSGEVTDVDSVLGAVNKDLKEGIEMLLEVAFPFIEPSPLPIVDLGAYFEWC